MIYTITLLSDIVDKKHTNGKVFKHRDSRSVGFFFKKDDAINSVINNDGFMRDDFYTFAVIEKLEEGIYTYACEKQTWLSWDKIYTCWQFIDAPEDMESTVGFAMG
jgi:hypothetical protein